MTLPLPDPRVNDHPWELERDGVQRNFEGLARQFPLECSTANFREVPQVRATRTTDTSGYTSGAAAASVAFTTEDFDRGTSAGMHDNSTNNSRLTVAVAGLYAVTANIAWEANGSGRRVAIIWANGATNLAESEVAPASATTFTQQQVSTIFRFAVGDYVELMVTQDSGSSLVLKAPATNAACHFGMYWVSP